MKMSIVARGLLVGVALSLAVPVLAQSRPGGGAEEVNRAIIDANWKVAAGTMHGTLVTVPLPMRLRVNIDGVANYGKGYKVRIVPGKVWTDYVQGKATKKALEDFPAELTGEYNRTRDFDVGAWAVVVENSENMLKSLTVHVQVRLARSQAR